MNALGLGDLNPEQRKRMMTQAGVLVGAGALTYTLLKLFQDNASHHASDGLGMKPKPLEQRRRTDAASTPTLVSSQLPQIGTGMDVVEDFVKGLLKLANSASEQPNFLGTIDNFGQNIIVLSRASDVHKVLHDQTAHALGGLLPASKAFFGKNVLFILEGKEWRDLRKTMRSALQHQRVELMNSDVESAAITLESKMALYANNESPIDVGFAFSMFHLSAVGKSAMNFDFKCVDELHKGPNEIVKSFEFMLMELPRRSFSQDESVREDFESDNEDNRKWKAAAMVARNAISKVVRRRLKQPSGAADRRGDLLDGLLLAYEEEHGPDALKEDIIVGELGDNLVEMLFAGYNTSVVGMTVVLREIFVNGLSVKVQADVDAGFARAEAENRKIKVEDFPYVKACFLEALRLVPPAPLLFRKITRPGTVISGVELEVGAHVWVPAIHTAHDKANWGPDANVYRPERWLTGKEIVPGSFVAFSGGPRECIGKHFAILESVFALAHCLRSYEFSVAENVEYAAIFTGFGIRPMDLATGRVGLPMKVTSRAENTDWMYDWSPRKQARPPTEEE